ncbi:MAG: GDP-mannose 4,6-dehydratase [Nitrospinota bacterium]|nr:GDP-mannose 4,6-dehydratase [Nitrospinota bacterium]
MSKKVLISGGAGFIGSNICRILLENGQKPIVYDAFIQYVSPFESSYQKHLEYRFRGIKDQVTFVRGDTRDKNDVRKVIMEHKPEVIIHLAALPIADLSFTHTEETTGSILNGTLNFLDTIHEVDFVERFVYTSSSMVYGDFKSIPALEEHPKAPKDVYGGTKLAGEILTETYSRRYGIKYSIVRPSAVYGPTDVNRRVCQILIEKAIRGEKLTIYGGEDNVLDFTYVEDTAQGFVKVALSDSGENEVFNITRGEGRSLIDLIDLIKGYFPNIEIVKKPMQHYRPKRGALSIQKARDLLNYEPKYSLEDGLKKYIEFYEAFNNAT